MIRAVRIVGVKHDWLRTEFYLTRQPAIAQIDWIAYALDAGFVVTSVEIAVLKMAVRQIPYRALEGKLNKRFWLLKASVR
ncbi:hypothetical protein GO755_36550 [Spirosoma sp. HMF4905]|uniref:Uncharacterized protein n=1 Tax=Spirosoma arboris TaxID=2682092 RepID=A0A7K1SP58_9BACT|nr:hypothetical protein [Spirosoma arboris]MVM35585.1 hypothetical protein [Spirosoma arboris]